VKKIELAKEEQTYVLTQIKNYFSNERDEEIGDLQAMILLDFFMEVVGKTAYNKGVDDAKRYMDLKLEDIYEILI
jgi:uncharacterized protein (DUF2164 family)